MSNFKQAFGLRLKLIRKSKNLTQEKLAECIDIHPRQMSKIETGEHFPSCKTLERICVALNVSPSFLFDFDFDFEITPTAENCVLKTSSLDLQYETNMTNIISLFRKVSKNDNFVEFTQLAIKALFDDKALEKLEYTIAGMKLSRKNNKN